MNNRLLFTRQLHLLVFGCLAAWAACSCHSPSVISPRSEVCPANQRASLLLPGVRPEHRKASYWHQQAARFGSIDKILFSPDDIAAFNAARRKERESELFGRVDLGAPVSIAEVVRDVEKRQQGMKELSRTRGYVDINGNIVTVETLDFAKALQAIRSKRLAIHPRVAIGLVPMRCAPYRGLLTFGNSQIDHNLCSTLKSQEVVQILAAFDNTWLVRTSYNLGFIPQTASLSSPLNPQQTEAFLGGSHHFVSRQQTLDDIGLTIRVGDLLPVLPSGKLLVAHAGGFQEMSASRVIGSSHIGQSLTRRALYTVALSFVGGPYSWGGKQGGWDCSELQIRIFAPFGLELPRFSGDQANTGDSRAIPPGLSLAKRLERIDQAQAGGIVLLYLPGHIMLYLGQDRSGLPMVLHSLTEYMEPCPDNSGETRYIVERVEVTDIHLGKGSSRGSFLERINRIVVLGTHQNTKESEP